MPPRILFVDDSALERSVYGSVLEQKGFEVIHAASGKQAIALLKTQPYDLALIDLNMPDVDGFAVLQNVRSQYSPLELPVVILTASDVSDDIVRALNEGANDYVVKSSASEVLLARLKTHLAMRRQAIDLEELSENIKRSQIELQTIVDSFDDLLFLVDKHNVIQRVNRAAAAFLGTSFKNLLGAPLGTLLPSLQLEAVASGALRIVSLGERQFRIGLHGPISSPGDRIAIVLRDVTEEMAQHAELERRVVLRTSELRQLAARLDRIREDEQTRLSRELHDEFGQVLTSAKLDVDWIGRRLGDVDDDVRGAFDSLRASIDALALQTQRIATELRPTLLDRLDLNAAIQWHAAAFERRTNIAINVSVPDRQPTLTADQTTAIYRIVQEALTNAARHA